MGGVLGDAGWVDRLEALVAAATVSGRCTSFLRDVGGYTGREIDAMRRTPVWEARLATMPTAARAARRARLPAPSGGAGRLTCRR